jgi:integrase
MVTCLDEYATEGSLSALAVATTLLLGLRASECTDRIVRDLDDGGRVLWIPHGKTEAAIRQLKVPELLQPLLMEVAAGKAPLDRLWGNVDRHWLGHHVRRLCRKAGVPVIPPHGLRGLHATMALSAGASSEHVAKALGHVSVNTTRAHYFAPGAETDQALTSLAGLVTRELPSVPNGEVPERLQLSTPGND